ncbi:MAG: hypothetical protein V3V20_09280, partial [Algisphaera sp.]
EYRPRLLINARADELTQITLLGPTAQVSPPPPATPQNITHITALRDRLAGLRAETWLPSSPAPSPNANHWSLNIVAGPHTWVLTCENNGPYRLDGRPLRLSEADTQSLSALIQKELENTPQATPPPHHPK